MALKKATAGLLRAPKAVWTTAGAASVFSKPPRQRIGAGQSFLVMSVFAVAMLAPAAWILHHLPEYRRSRSPPQGRQMSADGLPAPPQN